MKKIFLTLIVTILTVVQVFAQQDPVIVGSRKGDPNASLDISSDGGKKGFMPPKLTAAQIETLQASLTDANKGLTVYNTDENCLQSWKGDSWTECNAITIAKFDFNCASSAIKGNYYKDAPVTVNEYIELAVVVKKPGTFTFYSDTKNGVRFFYSSIFAEASVTPQIIQIPAIGTPVAEGNFTYNLYNQSGTIICPGSFTTSVTENKAIFTVNCANTAVNGTYTENQPVATSNTMTMQLNVTKSGNFAIKTDKVNGMWFEGTGFVSPGTAQTVVLNAYGTPTWNDATNGLLTYNLFDKAGNSYGCQVNVQLQSVQSTYTVNCSSGVKVDGLLIAGQPSTGQNKITLTTNVSKVGPWNMETNIINGLKFASAGTFTASGNNEVILYADGTPSTAGTQKYTITDKIANSTICSDVNVVVSPNEAIFTAGSCSAASQSGTWKSNNPLSGATVTLNLTATQGGPYNLTANGSGISLTASGTAVAGTNTIVFAASGTPTASGTLNLPIVNSKGLDICTITVNVTPGKGSKENPATSCAEILSDTPGATDGEYWIKPASGYTGDAIKTFCDMTNGGYTLVWSFNEQTALNSYQDIGEGDIDGDYFRFNVDQPKNADNYTSETIDYTNFRLPRAVMRGLSPENQLVFKARIASSVAAAKDMQDANALANYIVFPTVYNNLDIRYDACTEYNWKGSGKLLNVPFGTGVYNTAYYGTKTTGVQILPYHSGGFAFHIDWNGGSTVAGAGNPNYFGWFGEGGQEVNGHFYNCKNGQAACSGNTTGSSGVMVSNATTGGRLMQYFMK